MSDNDEGKSPKKWFNLEAEDKVVAEKDNSGRTFKPDLHVIEFIPEFAPVGSVPVKRNVTNAHEAPPQENEVKIDLSYDPTVEIDGKSGSLDFIVKQEDAPQTKGLDGGRISRLTVMQDGMERAHFKDGEWKLSPKTPQELQLVDDLKDKFNETPTKKFKSFNDKSIGSENEHDL